MKRLVLSAAAVDRAVRRASPLRKKRRKKPLRKNLSRKRRRSRPRSALPPAAVRKKAARRKRVERKKAARKAKPRKRSSQLESETKAASDRGLLYFVRGRANLGLARVPIRDRYVHNHFLPCTA